MSRTERKKGGEENVKMAEDTIKSVCGGEILKKREWKVSLAHFFILFLVSLDILARASLDSCDSRAVSVRSWFPNGFFFNWAIVEIYFECHVCFAISFTGFRDVACFFKTPQSPLDSRRFSSFAWTNSANKTVISTGVTAEIPFSTADVQCNDL